MKAIFLNGPPGSGKDTAGRILQQRFNQAPHKVVLHKFAEPLKKAVHALFDLPAEDAPEAIDRKGLKDTPIDASLFPHLTYRKAYIDMSEEFAKRLYREDFFGHIACNSILKKNWGNIHVFTDCGFAAETVPIIEALDRHNCLLIRLSRPGHDYVGDSRSDISVPCKMVDINNQFDEQMFYAQVERVVEDWLRIERA